MASEQFIVEVFSVDWDLTHGTMRCSGDIIGDVINEKRWKWRQDQCQQPPGSCGICLNVSVIRLRTDIKQNTSHHITSPQEAQTLHLSMLNWVEIEQKLAKVFKHVIKQNCNPG